MSLQKIRCCSPLRIFLCLIYPDKRLKTSMKEFEIFMASKSYEVDDAQLREFHSQLGERIKGLRLAKDYMNHEKFANDQGFARAQYNTYKRGVGMNYTTIVEISAAMCISLKEFFSQGFLDFEQLNDQL